MDTKVVIVICLFLLSFSLISSFFGAILIWPKDDASNLSGTPPYTPIRNDGGGGSKTNEPRAYAETKGLVLIGQVESAKPSSLAECKKQCDQTPKCDWMEMHGGTCVLKNFTMPAECVGDNPARKCADGFKNGVTLYNPKNKNGTSVLPSLDPLVNTLLALEEEDRCIGACKTGKILKIVSIVVQVVGAVIGGLGAVIASPVVLAADLGFVLADVGVDVADSVVSVRNGKDTQKRLELVQKGIVRCNAPMKWVATSYCRKQEYASGVNGVITTNQLKAGWKEPACIRDTMAKFK